MKPEIKEETKKTLKKTLSVCLCGVLLVGASAGAVVYAEIQDPQKETETASATAAVSAPEDNGAKREGTENTKDETVYVLAGADGDVQKIIVSDWIKNALGADVLQEKSELSDVQNVRGDETYTMSGDHMRVWDAHGNDIYYQGNIKKELPVNMSVSYTLDGKAISPSDLAGKSGHVVIRFDYQNNQYVMKSVNGKTEKIYVPFAMLTGMLLDNQVFTDVQVSNGKLINDGDHTAVVGMAFPGLSDNLRVDPSRLDIPDYVEISAEVKDFAMTTTMTIAANEMFNEIDMNDTNSIEELTDSLDQLKDAMEQLIDGSSALYDGLCTLLEKSDELIAGIDQLAEGAEVLKKGAGDVDAGAAQLQKGAAALSDGLGTLKANNDTLNGGAKQVFETLLATANQQISDAGLSIPALTIENYDEVLGKVISSLDKNAVYQQALAKVTEAVEKQKPMIEDKVTEVVRVQVTEKVTAAVQEQVAAQVTEAVQAQVSAQVIAQATKGQMTKETYDAAVAAGKIDQTTQEAIQSEIHKQMSSDKVKQTIAQNVSARMAGEDVKKLIASKVEEQMQTEEVRKTVAENVQLQMDKAISENMASDEVKAQMQAASEAAKPLIALKTSLDSYNAFYLGLMAYTDGVSQAADGANELKSGAAQLKDGTAKLNAGAKALYDGILQLKDGAPALMDGVTQLRDGSMELSKGLKEFNEKGVQKLLEAADGDLGGLMERLRATIDVSKDYRSFSDAGTDMDGQVKFVYRTDSIEAEKEETEK